jgi:hypothetical protein
MKKYSFTKHVFGHIFELEFKILSQLFKISKKYTIKIIFQICESMFE